MFYFMGGFYGVDINKILDNLCKPTWNVPVKNKKQKKEKK